MVNIIQKIPEIKHYFVALQNRICNMLEKEETDVHFLKDVWEHPAGGGGVTGVMAEGAIIEKAGVNFSHVLGASLPAAATLKRAQLANCPFEAMGVSVVIHPRNPYVPTAHLNVRFVVVKEKETEVKWWFGGGFDLTPYYGFIEDCEYWHHMAKEACEPFGSDIYPRFKKCCDDYFYLKHRNEPRGVGGIFFDDLNEWGFERTFTFVQRVGDHFLKAYQPIIERRKNTLFTERERSFQQYRRGRYVEFNLLYDRGTLFGLQSGGRTESILISLPPTVSWKYDGATQFSCEEELLKEFLMKIEWV